MGRGWEGTPWEDQDTIAWKHQKQITILFYLKFALGGGERKQNFDLFLQKALIEHLGYTVYICMPQFPKCFM